MYSPRSPGFRPTELGAPPAPGLAERVVAGGRARAVCAYVATARGARRLARASGALEALDRRRDRPLPRYVRSLLAVHDVDELDRLDLPMWTFGAIERIDAFLRARPGARAFEWGAGASTFWLARRCARVTSLEHDPAWWRILAPRLERCPHVEGRLQPPAPAREPLCPSDRAGYGGQDFAAYVHAILDAGGPFDLIVIDGRARAACLDAALHHLAPDGLIAFDNSERLRYADALDGSRLHCERIPGLAPSTPWPSETALLAREPTTRGAL